MPLLVSCFDLRVDFKEAIKDMGLDFGVSNQKILLLLLFFLGGYVLLLTSPLL